jgi:quinoprotein glucose dehydrogenase
MTPSDVRGFSIHTLKHQSISLLFMLVFSLVAFAQKDVDWPAYNGGVNGNHYSSLKQINRNNVNRLRVAWRFDTGEKGQIQTNPMIIGRTLYAYTPSQKVVALDAATGQLKWTFDSGVNGTQPARGFAYWSSENQSRLFAGIMNFLYCLDPETGKPIPSFGEDGRVDLRKGLGRNFETQSIAMTSPGVVYKDLIIVGGRNPETHPAPPGYIRAFDVHTGEQRWVFHTIPLPGEPGYETWPKDAWKTAGAANNWAGMSLDARHGIVYVPTGSAVMDFYGGDRVGNDLYANCLLALDAETGKLLWHFQGVHHDIWDRDFPSPPALITLPRDGKAVDALAQTSKQGYLYLFNRLTGEPLFPIRERPYPASTVPGEVTAPTQPLPEGPEPFAARQELTADMLTTRSPEAHAWALEAFHNLRSKGQFYPMTVGQETIVFPGFDGGAEWGGPAVDPVSNVLFVNENEMAWRGGLIPREKTENLGERVYKDQCALCHSVDRTGSPPAFPSLIGIQKRLPEEKILSTIRQGTGRMPSFPDITGDRLQALLDYLHTDPAVPPKTEMTSTPVEPAAGSEGEDAYTFTGYKKFLDPDGYPAIAPPWGTLNAIDLKTGKYLWKIPFGEYPELAEKGMKSTGSENYGGPIATAGGVLFIGATVYDRKFHAFDMRNGKLLWQYELPFAGMATPATYMIDGRQYVVTVSSGGRDPKSPVGGSYVAFALLQ